MSLDKSIEHGKEHRKLYHDPKAIDPSCRNHGSCPHFYQNEHRKEEEEMRSKIEETKETGDEESSVLI